MTESQPLLGRTAFVTGAALRTGREIAYRLARAGADLIIHYHSSERAADELAGQVSRIGRRAIRVRGDLSRPGTGEELMARVEREVDALDILINNVGIYPRVPPLGQTEGQFAATLQTNLIAPYALVKAAHGLLRRRGEADVINLGYAGSDHVLANRHAMSYQISKTGLLIMTRTLAEELGPEGIRVNMVSPGHLDNSVDLPERIEAHVPLGRAGTPAEVAECILYLLTLGRYITGANIEVAGGYRLGLARRVRDES